VCVCVFVCVCVCVCVWAPPPPSLASTSAHDYRGLKVSLHACMCMSMCMCACVFVHVSVRKSMCMCACVWLISPRVQTTGLLACTLAQQPASLNPAGAPVCHRRIVRSHFGQAGELVVVHLRGAGEGSGHSQQSSGRVRAHTPHTHLFLCDCAQGLQREGEERGGAQSTGEGKAQERAYKTQCGHRHELDEA